METIRKRAETLVNLLMSESALMGKGDAMEAHERQVQTVLDVLQAENQRWREAARKVLLGRPRSLTEALAEIEFECREE